MRAHLAFVLVLARVATEPTPIHFWMSKPTEFMIMIVSFRAPTGAQATQFVVGQYSQGIHLLSRQCRYGNANIPPQPGSRRRFSTKKETPLVRRELQMARMCRIANKLIVTTKHIFRRPHILVKTQEYRALGIARIIGQRRLSRTRRDTRQLGRRLGCFEHAR